MPTIAPSAAMPERPFDEPWQARVFAVMVALHDQGHFDWHSFQKSLADRIAEDETQQFGRGYYTNWLLAAEDLLITNGLVPAPVPKRPDSDGADRA